jgi:multiple sugar transport system permease protein
MRHLLFPILAALLSLSSLHAKEKITLRVSGLGPTSTVSATGAAQARVLLEFKKRHPHIEILPAEGLSIEGLSDEIGPLMMVAGGIAPDVMSVNFRKIDSYVRQGMLLPLDSFILEKEQSTPGWRKALILPQIRDVVTRPNADGQKHIYALPTRYSLMGLYYNRQLFRQAGLPQRAPKNWDELVEFAQKIQALDPRNRGLFLSDGQQSSWSLMNFLWSSGAEAVVETEPNEWRAAFDSEQAVDAFEFYYRLVAGDRLAIRGNMGQMVNSGEARYIGMQFSYIGSQISLDPGIWGFGAVPEGPGGLRGAEINASMLGIFSGVKDPEIQRAAWDFIEFMGSEEANKIRIDTFIEMGLVNQINPVDLRKYGHDAFLELSDPGLEAEFQTALASAKPEPYGKNCNLVYVELTYPLDQMLMSSEISMAWQSGDRETVRNEIRRILQLAVNRTNERMLGVVAPEKMGFRRTIAWIVVALIATAFLWVGVVIFKTFSHAGHATNRVRGVQKYYAWGLLAIPVLLTLMWSYIPLVRGGVMALLDYQLLLQSTFVGIDNFANVLFNQRFWISMLATLHFTFWMLTAGFATPILLAYLLHLAPRHKILFRTIYYLPALISGAAVYVLWKQFFSANGMVNEFLSAIGISYSKNWSEDPFLGMLSCVIPAIWAGAGPGCLIYLAALKTIPVEQFEAAEIDGAGFFDKTRLIVYPALKPLITMTFLGAVTGAFQSSQNILIMTGGGPNGSTEVAALHIFYEAFMFLNFGPATAMAWILGFMLIGFTLLQLRRLNQMEFKSGPR